MFTVNGKELDYDIFDAEKAEAYENAMTLVAEKMSDFEKESNNRTYAQSIRVQCEAVAVCFDTLFGEGTADTIFGKSVNLKTALKAFSELVSGVNNKKTEIDDIARTAKVNTVGNRAQRRKKK